MVLALLCAVIFLVVTGFDLWVSTGTHGSYCVAVHYWDQARLWGPGQFSSAPLLASLVTWAIHSGREQVFLWYSILYWTLAFSAIQFWYSPLVINSNTCVCVYKFLLLGHWGLGWVVERENWILDEQEFSVLWVKGAGKKAELIWITERRQWGGASGLSGPRVQSTLESRSTFFPLQPQPGSDLPLLRFSAAYENATTCLGWFGLDAAGTWNSRRVWGRREGL